MTDLEITKLCAEAMGYRLNIVGDYCYLPSDREWNPLHDDAQAMAMVKRFRLDVSGVYAKWQACKVRGDFSGTLAEAMADDLNRAICECVARMQQAKAG